MNYFLSETTKLLLRLEKLLGPDVPTDPHQRKRNGVYQLKSRCYKQIICIIRPYYDLEQILTANYTIAPPVGLLDKVYVYEIK